MQIAILGRQHKISLAELEALFGAENVTAIDDYAALIDSDHPLPQTQLGGTLKSAKLLTKLENTDLAEAFYYLQTSIPEHLQYLEKGKLQLGVSVYGFKAKRDWLLKQMLTLKKIIKKTGQSVRIIENKAEALESAQVLYNKLTGPLGWELLIIKDGTDVIIAQTTAVQNIDAYSARDFDRPMRDAYVGMLPPKLAQIMLNLAAGDKFLVLSSQSLDKKDSKNQDLRTKNLVLDPFCGTGVVLQEALLMGFNAYGSDISEKMVDYSTKNLQWLTRSVIPDSDRESSGSNIAKGDTKSNWIPDQVRDDTTTWRVESGDATNHTWSFPDLQSSVSSLFIVCETYLGTPLTTLPSKTELEKIMNEANQIAEGFLKNLAPQIGPGTKLCLALPAWFSGSSVSSYFHLKVLDHLTDLGYNRLDFVHSNYSELIYHRPDQIVARELTVLERI